jgi:streptogramin lyase
MGAAGRGSLRRRENVRSTSKALSARPTSAMPTGPRMRLGMATALLALLAFIVPALASANPLGETTIYKSGLRATAFPINITAGPDGNVWFNDYKLFSSGVAAVGRVKPSGEITEYLQNADESPKLAGLNAGSEPIAVATGPDGNLWFTDRNLSAPAIGKINPASPETAEEFSAGLNAESNPQGIVAGPDGNLWFADASETTPAIGMINPSKPSEIKECSAGLNPGSRPRGIVAGSDGNLWFTDPGETTAAIGRINPSTCEIKEFTVPGSGPGGGNSNAGPWGIALGADENVWFTENGTKIAICSITPSGTIKCFEEGLAASSHPTGLTAAPDGKLWFTDESSVQETQELAIEDSGALAGIYKLGYKGNETGATGSGNLLSSAKGKGDVKRYPTTGNATCKRTTGSKVLKTCNNEPSVKAEVGMRINGTGIAAETVITKIEGENIFISNAVTGAAQELSTTNINAGRIINVETTTGKFETGQTISGTGISASPIIVVGEKEGKGTITPANVPTAVGTGVALTASTTTVVTGVKTSTGAFSVGEQITGTGITAGTTITLINTNTNSMTLSATPAAGTEVSLTANLRFDASAAAIAAALEKLPGIGAGIGAPNVAVSGSGGTSPITRTISFKEGLAGVDIELLSCNGTGLTGTSPTCKVNTTITSVPSAVGSISTTGKITRYPRESFGASMAGITAGPDGNLWFPIGTRGNAKIVRFGITPPVKKLTVKKTGAGTGKVTSSPAGIDCGATCFANFEEGSEVELTPSPESGSEFRGWGGACSGLGICKVTMSEGKEVTAFFSHAKQALTVVQEGSGVGSISSKPKAIKCASTCTKAVAALYKDTTVVLTAKATTGSKLSGFSGCESETKSELEGTCTVKMSAAKEVKASFGGTAKAILNPVVLSFAKATGTGKGTVKASGLTCEADCTSTAVKYTSGDGGKKLPAKVVLKEAPALGSSFFGWTGCESNPTPSECVVTTSSAKEATARFDALPTETLTVVQEGTGAGTTSSKPKGIKCAGTCTSAVAQLPEGTTVVLTAKAMSGSKLSGFSGCESETKSELEGTCTVKMSAAKEVKASFGGTAKAILNPVVLSFAKAGTGYGTVKASGLTCEVACTSTQVKYTSGDGGKKLPAKVVLKATSQAGSDPVSWTGCESNPTPSECVVTTTAAKAVTARFEE